MDSAGLIDLQVNGYAGVDFNDAGLTADALDHALAAMLRAGVTACLPTIITASEADLAARLAALDAAVARSRLGPLMVPGFHLEGPFLNPSTGTRGCHPARCMVPPDPALLARLCAGLRRPILLLTLAPELPGAATLIRAARAAGMLVAIGHAAPTAAEIAAAAVAGATVSTHLGNGLPALLPKLDNPLMAQLADDRLAACFVADGIHLPPFALKAMLRAKGVVRSVLVTDAVAGADAPPGDYRFAGVAIRRGEDGSVRLPEAGTLAGAALRLDQAVRNVVGWDFADAGQAIAMASANPAALLAGLGVSVPGTAPGGTAVAWSADLHVRRVRLGDTDTWSDRHDEP
ncbi:MAG TPA: amidohydrolase family protein [Acetobacteraceae bacterium]|nr:amidohydrolase family protein [Acetobacteraceae bacterium]